MVKGHDPFSEYFTVKVLNENLFKNIRKYLEDIFSSGEFHNFRI